MFSMSTHTEPDKRAIAVSVDIMNPGFYTLVLYYNNNENRVGCDLWVQYTNG